MAQSQPSAMESRGEAEEIFHQHLLELLHEFEQLRARGLDRIMSMFIMIFYYNLDVIVVSLMKYYIKTMMISRRDSIRGCSQDMLRAAAGAC